MSNPFCTLDSTAQFFGVSWNPNDADIPQYKSAYMKVANQTELTEGGSNCLGWINQIMVSLQWRRLFYNPAYEGANPCGQPNASGPGATQLSLYAAGTADTLAGTGASIAGGAAGAAGAIGATAAAAIPIVGAAIAGITALMTIFSSHAQAVAQEHGIICQITAGYNAAVAQIDAAVQAGKITAAVGLQELQALTNQAVGQLQPHAHVENAYNGYINFIKAHYQFRVWWYAQLEAANKAAASPLSSVSKVASTTSGKALLVAGGAYLAHLGGLF